MLDGLVVQKKMYIFNIKYTLFVSYKKVFCRLSIRIGYQFVDLSLSWARLGSIISLTWPHGLGNWPHGINILIICR